MANKKPSFYTNDFISNPDKYDNSKPPQESKDFIEDYTKPTSNFKEVKKLYRIAQLINQLNMGRLEKEIVEDVKYEGPWQKFKMGYGRKLLKFADMMQSYI